MEIYALTNSETFSLYLYLYKMHIRKTTKQDSASLSRWTDKMKSGSFVRKALKFFFKKSEINILLMDGEKKKKKKGMEERKNGQ